MPVLAILIVSAALVLRPAALQTQSMLSMNTTIMAATTGRGSSKALTYEHRRSLSSVATIIAMDMRLPENYAERKSRLVAINKHTEGTDVFLCTDRQDAGDTEGLEHVVLKKFAEELPDFAEKDPNAVQWWRLQVCYAALEQFAAESQHEYSFIFKTRLDLDVSLRVADIAQRFRGTTGKTAFVASDYVFGGPPAAMSVLAKLGEDFQSYYVGKCGCPYNSDEIDLMFASDWSAGRFECLSFPLEAVENICSLKIEYVADGPPYHKTNMRSILMGNMTGLKSQQGGSCDPVNICDGKYGGQGLGWFGRASDKFSSERAMVRHLLHHGVLIKELKGVKITFLQDRWADALVQNKNSFNSKATHAEMEKMFVQNVMLAKDNERCRGV